MSLKTFKSYTKSTRGTILVDRKNLWKGKPLKSLTFGQTSTGGRNNLGRITSRHKGAGHKHKYREIDFYRKKDDMKAVVERIEYDPNRSAYVALIKYEDGLMNYIIAPNKIKKGDEVISGKNKEVQIGNCMPLSDIPSGTDIHNIELTPNSGGKIALLIIVSGLIPNLYWIETDISFAYWDAKATDDLNEYKLGFDFNINDHLTVNLQREDDNINKESYTAGISLPLLY